MRSRSSILALPLALCLTATIRADKKSSIETSSASGKTVSFPSGAAHYERLCSGCHGSDGLASSGEAPPLAGSPWVSGPEVRLIRIVMQGMKGPVQIADEIYDREMPGVGYKLSNREAASLLSFVRSRWGASNVPTTPETVKRARAASKNSNRYWTVEELISAR